MAKKVIGEDGKTYTMKEKKPFYKKFGLGIGCYCFNNYWRIAWW